MISQEGHRIGCGRLGPRSWLRLCIWTGHLTYHVDPNSCFAGRELSFARAGPGKITALRYCSSEIQNKQRGIFSIEQNQEQLTPCDLLWLQEPASQKP